MSLGEAEHVCSLQLFPGEEERDSEMLGSLDPAGDRHALSCTCLGLLHPAFQSALHLPCFVCCRATSPLAQVVLMFCREGAPKCLLSPCIAESTAVRVRASSGPPANSLSKTASQHRTLACKRGRNKTAKPGT